MLQVTNVKIFPNRNGDETLLAYVSITFNDAFIVRDVKIIDGLQGRVFVAMPSKKHSVTGEHKDVAHPLNPETREMIETEVLNAWDELQKRVAS